RIIVMPVTVTSSFCTETHRPRESSLFPYTTVFRSQGTRARAAEEVGAAALDGPPLAPSVCRQCLSKRSRYDADTEEDDARRSVDDGRGGRGGCRRSGAMDRSCAWLAAALTQDARRPHTRGSGRERAARG